VSNEAVYVGGIDGKLYCLNLKDGSERWSFETGGPIPGSPYVHDGYVFVGSTDHNIYALKA
jgi:outer membrane protein assembly factor BamB